MVTLTAMVPNLRPPQCTGEQRNHGQCIAPNKTQLAFLNLALFFLAIGGGGIRPFSIPFAVDQFDSTTHKGKKDINSFFNWYYFTFTFAMTFSVTLIVYVQSNVSWTLGLAIPTGLMLLSCALFFLGSRIYVKVKPQGSPLTSVAQVAVAATKKRLLKLPDHHDPHYPSDLSLFNHMPTNSMNSKLPHTDQFR